MTKPIIKKEIINIASDSSDHHSEEDEYVTVYGKDGIGLEVPLEDNNLLLADLRANFPSLISVRIEGNGMNRMLKAKNGAFKPPKTGWQGLRVIALFDDEPTNGPFSTASNSPRSTPFRNSASFDDVQQPTVSAADIPPDNFSRPASRPVITDQDLCGRFRVSSMIELLALPQFSHLLFFNQNSFFEYRAQFLKAYRGLLMRLGPETFDLAFIYDLYTRAKEFNIINSLLPSLTEIQRKKCERCDVVFCEPLTTFQHYASISHATKNKDSDALELVQIMKRAKELMMFPPPLQIQPMDLFRQRTLLPTPMPLISRQFATTHPVSYNHFRQASYAPNIFRNNSLPPHVRSKRVPRVSMAASNSKERRQLPNGPGEPSNYKKFASSNEEERSVANKKKAIVPSTSRVAKKRTFTSESEEDVPVKKQSKASTSHLPSKKNKAKISSSSESEDDVPVKKQSKASTSQLLPKKNKPKISLSSESEYSDELPDDPSSKKKGVEDLKTLKMQLNKFKKYKKLTQYQREEKQKLEKIIAVRGAKSKNKVNSSSETESSEEEEVIRPSKIPSKKQPVKAKQNVIKSKKNTFQLLPKESFKSGTKIAPPVKAKQNVIKSKKNTSQLPPKESSESETEIEYFSPDEDTKNRTKSPRQRKRQRQNKKK